MSTKKARTEYLSYIEDTPKHYSKLESMAKNASKKAIAAAKKKNIAITFIENGNIIREYPDGKRIIIGQITGAAREVKVGEQTKL